MSPSCRPRIRPLADRCRALLEATYGPSHGAREPHVEAFEMSEYGAPLVADERARLFPFLPAGPSAASSRKGWADMTEGD
jgi:hypothetical protein